MDDGDFDDLLDDYQPDGPSPNLNMLDVEIVWVRGNPSYGSDHIAINNVTEEEVEEVLLQVPPEVEAKRHKDHPGRTCFWGDTRRPLVVRRLRGLEGRRQTVPEAHQGVEPEEGESYWRQQ